MGIWSIRDWVNGDLEIGIEKGERFCTLVDDQIEPFGMQTGQVRKEHYASEKNGSCILFAVVEPLTGFRALICQVTNHLCV